MKFTIGIYEMNLRIYLERERENKMKNWLRTKPWKSQGTMLHFEEIPKASEMEPKRSTCVIQEYKRYKGETQNDIKKLKRSKGSMYLIKKLLID